MQLKLPGHTKLGIFVGRQLSYSGGMQRIIRCFLFLCSQGCPEREKLCDVCTLRYTVAYAEYSRNSKVGTWRRLAKAKGYLEDELVFLLVTELVFLG